MPSTAALAFAMAASASPIEAGQVNALAAELAPDHMAIPAKALSSFFKSISLFERLAFHVDGCRRAHKVTQNARRRHSRTAENRTLSNGEIGFCYPLSQDALAIGDEQAGTDDDRTAGPGQSIWEVAIMSA